jgi:hypothetical protein
MLVKLIPLEMQDIDREPEGYKNGTGISQWRLRDGIHVQGRFLAAIAPGESVPRRIL